MRRSIVLMICICNYTVASAPLLAPASLIKSLPPPATPNLPSCHSCFSWDPCLSWDPCSWHPCLSCPSLRPCPPSPGFPAPRPLPGVPDPPPLHGVPVSHVFPVSPVSPFQQSINGSASSVQVFYYWVSENLLETIVVASAITFFIVLTLRLDPLSSSYLTKSDLPSDPSLYKNYICLAFNIKFAEVIDLTGHINRCSFIAAGGSGEVYKGLWINLNKNPICTPEALPRVVVKLIKIPALGDVTKDKRYKRMKRELELWSKLNHPHILPLIGIARIEGDANLPAFISPWMENGNVMEFLRRNPSFPSVRFLKDIIKGLHYLHTFAPVIVHGDIKGANVLVNHRNEAYLSDFGLSYFVLDNTLWRTTAARAIGTLRWMAPELIEGVMITPTIASDIYAFAMTCYEILSRETPFNAVANDPAVMRKVTDGQRPERIESCHSDTTWSVITRCWAHEPEERPSIEETLTLILQLDVEVSIQKVVT